MDETHTTVHSDTKKSLEFVTKYKNKSFFWNDYSSLRLCGASSSVVAGQLKTHLSSSDFAIFAMSHRGTHTCQLFMNYKNSQF